MGNETRKIEYEVYASVFKRVALRFIRTFVAGFVAGMVLQMGSAPIETLAELDSYLVAGVIAGFTAILTAADKWARG